MLVISHMSYWNRRGAIITVQYKTRKNKTCPGIMLATVGLVYWSLTSPFVTVTYISTTDRNPEPGDDPHLFSKDYKGSFRCTQPQTVMHTTKPLLNQLGTTGICPHRSNQPTQDSNPGPSDHESQTLCVSPPSEDKATVDDIWQIEMW